MANEATLCTYRWELQESAEGRKERLQGKGFANVNRLEPVQGDQEVKNQCVDESASIILCRSICIIVHMIKGLY